MCARLRTKKTEQDERARREKRGVQQAVRLVRQDVEPRRTENGRRRCVWAGLGSARLGCARFRYDHTIIQRLALRPSNKLHAIMRNWRNYILSTIPKKRDGGLHIVFQFDWSTDSSRLFVDRSCLIRHVPLPRVCSLSFRTILG